MRKLFLILLVINGLLSNAQKTLEAGIMGGGLFYLGEISPTTIFHSTQFGGGVFIRHNLNKRWAFRGNFIIGTLYSDDANSTHKYQETRDLSFNTPVIEVVAQAEFNFLKYKLGAKRYSSFYTPYLASGIGFLMVSNSIKPYQLVLPISFGIKLAVTKRLEIGIEWSFRKTFTDHMDDLSGKEYNVSSMQTKNKSKYKQLAVLYNKDWYSYAGLFITYKFFQSGGPCKAYDF